MIQVCGSIHFVKAMLGKSHCTNPGELPARLVRTMQDATTFEKHSGLTWYARYAVL